MLSKIFQMISSLSITRSDPAFEGLGYGGFPTSWARAFALSTSHPCHNMPISCCLVLSGCPMINHINVP